MILGKLLSNGRNNLSKITITLSETTNQSHSEKTTLVRERSAQKNKDLWYLN